MAISCCSGGAEFPVGIAPLWREACLRLRVAQEPHARSNSVWDRDIVTWCGLTSCEDRLLVSFVSSDNKPNASRISYASSRLAKRPYHCLPLKIKFDPVGIGDLLEIARAAMEELLWRAECNKIETTCGASFRLKRGALSAFPSPWPCSLL